MKYISTRDPHFACNLKDALLGTNTPPAGKLLPDSMPVLPRAFFNNMREMTLSELAYVVLNTFFRGDIDSPTIKQIAEESLNYKLPLAQVDEDVYALEMFHGPTLGYKDLSVRLLARLFQYFNRGDNRPINILNTTNGNTGASIAAGFSKVPGTIVHVLYPKGSMTRMQEAMITSQGPNIRAVEVAGTIDDCRRIAAQAFDDRELAAQLRLTTVNSINIGRILTQTIAFYQIYTELSRLGINPAEVPVSVPCGNLGNLTAGLVAKSTGLPIGKLVAACNANDYLCRLLASNDNTAEARRTVHTLSATMDVMKPSNIERILRLYPTRSELLRDIAAESVDDATTADAINSTISRTGYVLDPHAAVAYAALRRHLTPGRKGVIMATAHPAKSLDTMTAITGRAIELPLQLTRYMNSKRASALIPPTYPALRKFLVSQQP